MADLNTKAFAAQDARVAGLQAAAGLAAWTVEFGLPAVRGEMHVWVDEHVEEWRQEAPTTGLVSREESFTLDVYLYARMTDAGALEVRDAITAAAAVVQNVIGSAPFLGGVALMAQVSGGEYDGAFADPEGRSREGLLLLKVECQTFLA